MVNRFPLSVSLFVYLLMPEHARHLAKHIIRAVSWCWGFHGRCIQLLSFSQISFDPIIFLSPRLFISEVALRHAFLWFLGRKSDTSSQIFLSLNFSSWNKIAQILIRITVLTGTHWPRMLSYLNKKTAFFWGGHLKGHPFPTGFCDLPGLTLAIPTWRSCFGVHAGTPFAPHSLAFIAKQAACALN